MLHCRINTCTIGDYYVTQGNQQDTQKVPGQLSTRNGSIHF